MDNLSSRLKEYAHLPGFEVFTFSHFGIPENIWSSLKFECCIVAAKICDSAGNVRFCDHRRVALVFQGKSQRPKICSSHFDFRNLAVDHALTFIRDYVGMFEGVELTEPSIPDPLPCFDSSPLIATNEETGPTKAACIDDIFSFKATSEIVFYQVTDFTTDGLIKLRPIQNYCRQQKVTPVPHSFLVDSPEGELYAQTKNGHVYLENDKEVFAVIPQTIAGHTIYPSFSL